MLRDGLRWSCFRLLSLLVLGCASAVAQQIIPVTGVVDRGTYDDRVSLRVPAQVGFAYFVTLNGVPILPNVPVQLTEPDFYELWVTRTPMGGGGTEVSELTRFILAASERKGTEWGLPVHVPGPSIPSSPAEFVGGRLRVMLPERISAGVAVPVTAWVEDEDGHALRVNGSVRAAGQIAFTLHRGVGAGWYSASGTEGPTLVQYEVGGLSDVKHLVIEAPSLWTSVSGVLPKQTDWPSGSRIWVTGSLSIPAGGVLTIGPGSHVRFQEKLNLTNNGSLRILGTREDPVLFSPGVPTKPWGGVIMRSGTGEVEGRGVIFTGSGSDPVWFGAPGNPGSHRKEQALFFVNDSQKVKLTDAAAVFLSGQLGHAVKGGSFEFDHFLLQRTTSGGEFTGSQFTVRDSAFIECPDDAPVFEDGDNDALYLVSGVHQFSHTLFGWTRDDGVDSGGSGFGRLTYERCWFEATFHEGNSLSGYKNTLARDTVYFDCGQGIEVGYDAPTGRVDHCLFVGCQSGVRHGDNYPSIGSYAGRITATNCLVLNNHRDVFGHNWRSGAWTNATGQMRIEGNWLTATNPYFPLNDVWNPIVDASRLSEFGGRERVGVGVAARPGKAWSEGFPAGLPLALSSFCTRPVEVQILLEYGDGREAMLSHRFDPGQVRGVVPLPEALVGTFQLRLLTAVNANITGVSRVLAQRSPTVVGQSLLVERGSVWKFRDDAVDLGNGWKEVLASDTAWPSGPGPFGYGDGAEGTLLRPTVATPVGPLTYYFRHGFEVTDPSAYQSLAFLVRRDDGVRVFLNGEESFRMNLPDNGSIVYQTPANTSVGGGDELAYFATNRPATLIKAGYNLIAAELHQFASNSGDAHFDLEVRGLPTPPLLQIHLHRFRDGLALSWDSGAVLWESARLDGGWVRVAGSVSPYELPAVGPSRFYRVTRP